MDSGGILSLGNKMTSYACIDITLVISLLLNKHESDEGIILDKTGEIVVDKQDTLLTSH